MIKFREDKFGLYTIFSFITGMGFMGTYFLLGNKDYLGTLILLAFTLLQLILMLKTYSTRDEVNKYVKKQEERRKEK